MMNKTILLVSTIMLTLNCDPVTYDIIFPEKYKASAETVDGKVDATYNDMNVMETQFLMNRVRVTGVLINNDLPSKSQFISVFPDYDLRVEDTKLNTEFEGKTDLILPAFEVEYGREPLEYLLSMLKLKYGINATPNRAIGMANQYGFSVKTSGELSEFPGSKMADYDMNADEIESLNGPLIGVYLSSSKGVLPSDIDQTIMNSTYDWSADEELDVTSIPVTNIIYLLNVNEEIFETEEFQRYGKADVLKESAYDIVQEMKKDDMNYVMSRIIFMENSVFRSDVFGLKRESPKNDKFLV